MRVLASPARAGAHDNRYVDLLYGPVRRSGVTVDDWSRRRALLGRYDVLHVHWPEFLVRTDSRVHAVRDVVSTLAVLAWARRRGAVLVWTGHDLEPHDPGGSALVRRFLAAFLRSVDGVLVLDASATALLRQRWPVLRGTPVAVVPHGHYRDVHPRPPGPRAVLCERLGLPVDGTVLLAFGQVRGYKNLPALVTAFAAVREPGETLVVAGRCTDDALRAELVAAAGPDVRLRLDGVDDADVGALLGACDVALQCYHDRSALNSGVLLLALSCGLPVVTAASPAAATIAARAGAGWVEQTDPDPAAVVAAGRALARRGPPPGVPDLSHLDWDVLAAATVAAYRAVLARRRGVEDAPTAVTGADVTVVVPVRDRADLLARALRSTAAQTVAPGCVVVVDDGSVDGSGDVARAHGATVLTRTGPGSISGARNAGVAHARTPWVAFLDSDDAWEPGHLAQLVAAAGEHVLVTAPAVTDDGRILGNPAGRAVALGPRSMLVPSGLVATSGTMLRRSAFEAVGGFRPVRQSEDLDLWIRTLELGSGTALAEPSVRYHSHSAQVSHDKGEMTDGFHWVLDRARERPWCTPAVVQQALVRLRWDDARLALRTGRRGDAVRGAAWIARHPRSWPGLAALLVQRRDSRRWSATRGS